MTTTPASTTSPVSSTLGARLRSFTGWADQVGAARLLHVTAVTVATAGLFVGQVPSSTNNLLQVGGAGAPSVVNRSPVSLFFKAVP